MENLRPREFENGKEDKSRRTTLKELLHDEIRFRSSALQETASDVLSPDARSPRPVLYKDWHLGRLEKHDMNIIDRARSANARECIRKGRRQWMECHQTRRTTKDQFSDENISQYVVFLWQQAQKKKDLENFFISAKYYLGLGTTFLNHYLEYFDLPPLENQLWKLESSSFWIQTADRVSIYKAAHDLLRIKFSRQISPTEHASKARKRVVSPDNEDHCKENRDLKQLKAKKKKKKNVANKLKNSF